MTPDDIRAYAPERIWAWPTGIQPASGSAGLWCDVPKFIRFGVATEYIRSDLHTAQIAALEAQLADGSFYKESDIDAMQDRIATLTAERDAARAVRVKPLVWRDDATVSTSSSQWPPGQYAVLLRDDGQYSLRMSWSLLMTDGYFDTLEAAKSAAQADYEARILAALEKPE
jgi:hypothetical protein